MLALKLVTIFFLLAECLESESDPEEIEVGNRYELDLPCMFIPLSHDSYSSVNQLVN